GGQKGGGERKKGGRERGGPNKETNKARILPPPPPVLHPLSRLPLSFCPTRWRRGLKTSRTVCSARQIMSRSLRSPRSVPSSVAGSVSSRRRRPTGSRFRTSGAASSVDRGCSSRRR